MELPSKLLEQTAFNTRPKIEEHMLVVLDESTHEEHLSEPVHTNNKQFGIAVTFLTGYNGIFKDTNSKNRFYFKKSIVDGGDFIQITIPQGSYEIEGLNNEIKRIIVDEGFYSENEHPFTIKPKFSTLGIIIQIIPQEPISTIQPNDSIRAF